MSTELKESGAVTALSVVGFVFGLIAMMGSFIPCLGAIAIYLAIPAAVISGVGLGIAYSQQAKRTFAIVALTVSLIGFVISGVQWISLMGAADNASKQMQQMRRN